MISILFSVTAKIPVTTIPPRVSTSQPQGSTEDLSSTSSWVSPAKETTLTVTHSRSSTEATDNRTGSTVSSTDSRPNSTGQSHSPHFNLILTWSTCCLSGQNKYVEMRQSKKHNPVIIRWSFFRFCLFFCSVRGICPEVINRFQQSSQKLTWMSISDTANQSQPTQKCCGHIYI